MDIIEAVAVLKKMLVDDDLNLVGKEIEAVRVAVTVLETANEPKVAALSVA